MHRLLSLFSSQRGASTIEIAATTCITVGLGWLLVLGGHQALKVSRETQCLSNLRQIHQAVMLYRVEHSSFPVLEEGGSLRQKMAPWLASLNVFHCPEDKISPGADSYSYFYAPRALGSEADGYMLGCPRHQNYSHGVTVMGSGVAETAKMSKILHNGVQIHPGQSFDYGEFMFEDGSVASIGMGGKSIARDKNDNGKNANENGNPNELPRVTPVISYKEADGKYHTILKIDEGSIGTARFSIVPGNHFEVVTPSAIIAVRGTEFSVQTLKQGAKHATRVEVFTGEVEMLPVGRGSGVHVKGGEKAFGLKGESPYLE
jgi:hypothetical protein